MFFKSKKSDTAAIPDKGDAPNIAPVVETAVDAIVPPSAKGKSNKKNKKRDEDLEYEWEFATPFGKIEFELDPKDVHEEKERKRREKREQQAAKKAERVAKQAAREAEKRGIAGPVVIVKRNNLLPALVIFAIVAGAVIVAVWLFARPDDEDELDAVPPELRNANALAGEPEPAASGIMGRIKKAVRAGKQASREAQREQEQKFEELSKQG